jgi:hypothetical protein
VAVADPAGGPAAHALSRATGREVVPALAPRHRLRALIEAMASRVAIPLPEIPAAAPAPPPPPPEPQAPPEDGHRVADLERALAEARGRLDAAEERVAAATNRVLELEEDLERATATLAAVRAAVSGGRSLT